MYGRECKHSNSLAKLVIYAEITNPKPQIMRAKVKVVVFPTDKSVCGHKYCSYCPAINYPFGCADSVEAVVANVQSYLLKLLCHRNIYRNLKNLGWDVADNSVKFPNFTDENAVGLTERYYSTKIVAHKIIVIDVEVPIIPKCQ